MASFMKLFCFMLIFVYSLASAFAEESTDIECFECKTDDDNCTTLVSKENFKICKIDKEVGCYTKLNGEKTERGCESKATEKICPQNGSTCNKCFENKCNAKPFPENRPKCIKCSGLECAVEHKKEDAIPCLEIKKSCFTFHNDTTTVRDCLSDVKICEENKKCNICSEDSCNIEKVDIIPFNCYRCRSDIYEEKNCADANVKGIIPSKCEHVWGDTKKECYTKKHNNIVFRGCVVDLFGDAVEQCNGKNTKICTTCNATGCNKDKAPGSNAVISKSISIIILMSTMISIFF